LKELEPLDWRTRSKLVQTYQALNKLPERDKERAELRRTRDLRMFFPEPSYDEMRSKVIQILETAANRTSQ